MSLKFSYIPHAQFLLLTSYISAVHLLQLMSNIDTFLLTKIQLKFILGFTLLVIHSMDFDQNPYRYPPLQYHIKQISLP